MSKIAKPKISKTDFIIQKAAGLSAEEAVAAAKKAGITISTGYVYTIRASAKKKAAKPAKQKPGADSTNTPAFEALERCYQRLKGHPTVSHVFAYENKSALEAGEATFAAMVSHIGLDRARALLDQMTERVSRALGA